MFKMKVSKEQVEGQELVPEGLYKVRFIKFRPAWTKKKQGATDAEWIASRTINLNPEFEITGPDAQYAGRKIYDRVNMQVRQVQNDLCHAFGVEMEIDPTDGEYFIPGTWEGKDFDQQKIETYDYQGPLIGKVGQVEVFHDSSWNAGKPQVAVRRYFCEVPDCATRNPKIRHSTNLYAGRK